jgi:hypothetical protein
VFAARPEETVMKVKIPLVVVLALAAAVGYLLGTEAGQVQRDRLLERLGRKEAEAEEAVAGASQILEDAAAE